MGGEFGWLESPFISGVRSEFGDIGFGTPGKQFGLGDPAGFADPDFHVNAIRGSVFRQLRFYLADRVRGFEILARLIAIAAKTIEKREMMKAAANYAGLSRLKIDLGDEDRNEGLQYRLG